MTAVGQSVSRKLLAERREAIAARWYEVIVRSSFVAVDAAELCEHITGLADRVLSVLLAEPFMPSDAVDIGKALARVRFTEPETLSRTLEMLTRELTAEPGLGDCGVHGARLGAVLGEIATGFLRQKRMSLLAEQEEIHGAHFAARRQAERALRASESRYRAVITQAAEGIVLVDPESGCIRESNPAFQQLLGYSSPELRAMTLYQLIVDEPARIARNLQRAARERHFTVHERRYRRKDGGLVTVEGSSTPIVTESGAVLCIVLRDISERAEAEAELEEARRGLAASREEERTRLARELHDGALQELAGLRYQLASVRRQPPGRSAEEMRAAIGEVEDRIQQIMGQLRELIAELRPTGLDERGLAAALENYVGRMPRNGPALPAIAVDVSPEVATLPPAVALCLFRVAQEAVRNAIKQGKPRQVMIRLRPRTQAVILRVSDDGRGFVVPARLNLLARKNHYGLVGMAERVAEVNGRLRIRSQPGKGTVVTAWVPLSMNGGGNDQDDSRSARR
jgi:PAS domain S-box-containing protein